MLSSTSEVYGDPLVCPRHEEYLVNVNLAGARDVSTRPSATLSV